MQLREADHKPPRSSAGCFRSAAAGPTGLQDLLHLGDSQLIKRPRLESAVTSQMPQGAQATVPRGWQVQCEAHQAVSSHCVVLRRIPAVPSAIGSAALCNAFGELLKLANAFGNTWK